MRELSSGIYFGEPRGIETLPGGTRRGFNTTVYTEEEVRRVARFSFELARSRRGRLCSVDKANVLETSVLWREVVVALHQAEFADVELSHMYVDNAAMQIVRDPRQFDVMDRIAAGLQFMIRADLYAQGITDLARFVESFSTTVRTQRTGTPRRYSVLRERLGLVRLQAEWLGDLESKSTSATSARSTA